MKRALVGIGWFLIALVYWVISYIPESWVRWSYSR